MSDKTIILLAEDDRGHAGLIKRGLKRNSIDNKVIHFADGQEVRDFLFSDRHIVQREKDASYILLLDIRMPRLDGISVLQQVKNHNELKKIPVIIITTTDNSFTINQCFQLGCAKYLVKPVGFEEFEKAMADLAEFIKTLMQVQ
ncbi:MAG: response regulator [Nitrospirae bacterium]|nr:response regulator [Nitrospirota bacterium]